MRRSPMFVFSENKHINNSDIFTWSLVQGDTQSFGEVGINGWNCGAHLNLWLFYAKSKTSSGALGTHAPVFLKTADSASSSLLR